MNRVLARQREIGVPGSFEWVREITPALADAVRNAGLEVIDHPLMVLEHARQTPPPPGVAKPVAS